MKRFIVLVTDNNGEYELRACNGARLSFLEHSTAFMQQLKKTAVIDKISDANGISIDELYEKLKEDGLNK